MRSLLLLTITVLLFSCGNRQQRPDVSGIRVQVALDRFEPLLFAADTNTLPASLQPAAQRFPQFFPFYFRQLLRMEPTAPELKLVLQSYRPIYDSLQAKFRNMEWYREALEESFRVVKYYYPNYVLPPRAITFIGTFDAPGMVLTPGYLGIGLHQYAGKQFSVYSSPQLREVYPEYISRRFDQEYLLPNSLKAIVDDIYPDTSNGRPLIEQMIEKGKQWYLLDLFLPDTHDSLKTGFTQKQLAWCKENEGNIWGFFNTNVDLYTIDPIIIQDYLGEGPFTRGMPEGFAPGNIGQWVGWQIVRTYAEKNGKLSVQELLARPAATLFAGAKYKPK
jgi:hypothetical protein